MAYRQVSLLLRRPPGREAFPGDIFNLHSRLLERAAKLNDRRAEVQSRLSEGRRLADRVADHRDAGRRLLGLHPDERHLASPMARFISNRDLFYAGVRPAVSVGLSVSRVGGNAQTKAMKKIAGTLRLSLAQYRELAAFAQLSSDLDKATKAQLDRGQRMVELLKQPQYQPMPIEEQTMVIWAATNGYLDEIPVDAIRRYESEFIAFIRNKYPVVVKTLREGKELSDEVASGLKKAADEFKLLFTSK